MCSTNRALRPVSVGGFTQSYMTGSTYVESSEVKTMQSLGKKAAKSSIITRVWVEWVF